MGEIIFAFFPLHSKSEADLMGDKLTKCVHVMDYLDAITIHASHSSLGSLEDGSGCYQAAIQETLSWS